MCKFTFCIICLRTNKKITAGYKLLRFSCSRGQQKKSFALKMNGFLINKYRTCSLILSLKSVFLSVLFGFLFFNQDNYSETENVDQQGVWNWTGHVIQRTNRNQELSEFEKVEKAQLNFYIYTVGTSRIVSLPLHYTGVCTRLQYTLDRVHLLSQT